jgi:uncharacterized protein YceH (UPF0502 family)
MPTILNDVEIRVLGSLVEKQITTPEYYPLTLNSLTLACNQKNNRYPVTSYSEIAVSEALETLRQKNLVYVFYGSTSRVPKYKHVLPEVMHLTPPEVAIMCALMLRGTQTPGELRGHGARLYPFSGLEEVEQTLEGLIAHEPEQLVVRLPRRPGQKETRFAHLLSGPFAAEEATQFEPAPRMRPRSEDAERLDQLESQVAGLTEELRRLRDQFQAFTEEFK